MFINITKMICYFYNFLIHIINSKYSFNYNVLAIKTQIFEYIYFRVLYCHLSFQLLYIDNTIQIQGCPKCNDNMLIKKMY